MSLKTTFTRREIAMLGANVGVASVAASALSWAGPAQAQ